MKIYNNIIASYSFKKLYFPKKNLNVFILLKAAIVGAGSGSGSGQVRSGQQRRMQPIKATHASMLIALLIAIDAIKPSHTGL
jgi:hypothetical protein